MLNDNETEVTPEIKAMLAETAKRAALWEAVEQRLTITYTDTEIVVSGRGTYDARHALKARGFKYDGNKAWRFTTKLYYAFRVSCGRLQDCKIRHIPEPANWIVDVARALGIEA